GRGLNTKKVSKKPRALHYLPDIYLNRSEALIGKGELVEALRFYGCIYRVEQRWEEARKCLEKSLDLNRQYGQTVSLGEALYSMGELEWDRGQSEAALDPLREAERIFGDAGAVPDLERVREKLAIILAA
ncbi:MAG: tetratricopeptide repeat protein, partial [Candidatus Latescibacterota bacterium]